MISLIDLAWARERRHIYRGYSSEHLAAFRYNKYVLRRDHEAAIAPSSVRREMLHGAGSTRVLNAVQVQMRRSKTEQI